MTETLRPRSPWNVIAVVIAAVLFGMMAHGQPELTNTEATNVDTAAERLAWQQAIGTDYDHRTGAFTAEANHRYIATGTFSVTDPSTPSEGDSFFVFIDGGSVTIGGTAYAAAGTGIFRVYESAAWTNYSSQPYDPAAVAITGGTISGVGSIGSTGNVTASSGDGEAILGSFDNFPFGDFSGVWLADPNATITPAFANAALYKQSDALLVNAPTGDDVNLTINGQAEASISTSGLTLSSGNALSFADGGSWTGATFSGAQSFSSTVDVTGKVTLSGVLDIENALPQIQIYETDAGADEKKWDLITNGSLLSMRLLNDAESAATTAFTISRSGSTVSEISIPTASVSVTGDLTVDTTSLHVDSTNNRVAVGATNPIVDFHVIKSGTVPPTASADTAAMFQNNTSILGNVAISLVGGTIGSKSIYFGDSSNEDDLEIRGTSANELNIYSGGTLTTRHTGTEFRVENVDLQMLSNSILFTSGASWDGATFSGAQSFASTVGVTGVLTATGGITYGTNGYLQYTSDGTGAQHTWDVPLTSYTPMYFDVNNYATGYVELNDGTHKFLGGQFYCGTASRPGSIRLYGSGGNDIQINASIASGPTASRIQSLPDAGGMIKTQGVHTGNGAVSLTADDQALSTDNVQNGYVSLTSDNATASNRTFTLPDPNYGASNACTLILKWADATNRGELLDSGNVALSAAWTPDENDTLALVFDGTIWVETSRSAN